MTGLATLTVTDADVIVDRLTLTSIDKAAHADQRRAADELAHASWPATGRDEWVLIRELKLRAVAASLGVRASALVRRLVSEAMHAGDPGAGQANAVRFRSKTELLAWLCHDLAARPGGGRRADRQHS